MDKEAPLSRRRVVEVQRCPSEKAFLDWSSRNRPRDIEHGFDDALDEWHSCWEFIDGQVQDSERTARLLVEGVGG